MRKLDPHRPIKTSAKIAEYMGYSRCHWNYLIAPRMKKFCCLWKEYENDKYHKGNQANHLVTTPFLISLYYALSAFYEQLKNDGIKDNKQ